MASATLVATHESLLLCTLPIAVLTWLRGRRARPHSFDRWAAGIADTLASLTGAWAMWTLATCPNDGSLTFVGSLVHLTPMNAVLNLLASITLSAWLLVPTLRQRRLSSFEILITTTATFLLAAAFGVVGLPAFADLSRSWCVLLVVNDQWALPDRFAWR